MEAAMEQNLEPERIASDEEAVAAGATLCQNEWMMFLQGLISTNQMVAEAVHAQMNAIMVHREESGEDHASLSAAMTRVNQNLELAEIMRQQIIQEAEEKTQEALASMKQRSRLLNGMTQICNMLGRRSRNRQNHLPVVQSMPCASSMVCSQDLPTIFVCAKSFICFFGLSAI